MTTLNDAIVIDIDTEALRMVRSYAARASIGGVSRIRAQAARQANLSTDQVVGQIGTYAGVRWLTGSDQQYRLGRWFADQAPRSGDGGADIPGSNIDFKARLHRNAWMAILDYDLAVRPAERHANWVYVHIVVELATTTARAHLLGWASDAMLPIRPNGTGPFTGAFILHAAELHPLPPFAWWGVPHAVALESAA